MTIHSQYSFYEKKKKKKWLVNSAIDKLELDMN